MYSVTHHNIFPRGIMRDLIKEIIKLTWHTWSNHKTGVNYFVPVLFPVTIKANKRTIGG